jgi:exodeoxyribonuclease-3
VINTRRGDKKPATQRREWYNLRSMVIASYNVNGIRAAMKKGLLEWAGGSGAEVICLQEIRATDEQIDRAVFESEGWCLETFPAIKPGYSGTGILSRKPGREIVRGTGNPNSDNEGRVMAGDWAGVRIHSVYAPSGSSGGARQDFKMTWLADFRSFSMKVARQGPSIFCGDFNICHKEIDIHNPKGLSGTSGFLPEEREWFTGWLGEGMTDSFRGINPSLAQYTWWSMRGRAREKNLGWRIDYAILCPEVARRTKRAWIDHQARCSDHCPVLVEID